MTIKFPETLLPQHLLSRFAGFLANIEEPHIKSFLIQYFIKKYTIDLSEAEDSTIAHYKNFNDFFIRRLKKTARPINQETKIIISPADGTIAEIGHINHNTLIQAKGHEFSLDDLLAQQTELISHFRNGNFATIYLAPYNYHRVHVPFDGKLIATYFVPGRLFSVNIANAKTIPSLYAKNERLICIFENDRLGKFAVIFVGAMIVGSIQLSFEQDPVRSNKLVTTILPAPRVFKKGEELGLFKLGSTVILLTEPNKLKWAQTRQAGDTIKLGETLGQTTY